MGGASTPPGRGHFYFVVRICTRNHIPSRGRTLHIPLETGAISSPGCPWTPRDPPSSVSQVLGLKACVAWWHTRFLIFLPLASTSRTISAIKIQKLWCMYLFIWFFKIGLLYMALAVLELRDHCLTQELVFMVK